MANPRVWNPPLPFNYPPGSLNLNALDVFVSQCINGVTGGAEAPIAPIIIGGAGFQVTSTLTIPSGGTLVLASGSTLTVAGALTVSGTATFASAINANAGVTLGVGQTVNFATRTYTRTIDHPPLYDTAHWQNFLDANSRVAVFSSLGVSGGNAPILTWVWRPPTGATVTAASVHLTPDTGHAGVPVVSVSVGKQTRGSNAAPNTASQTDASGSVGVYETPHELAVTGLSMTFAEGDLLLVRVTPETGANALTSLHVEPPVVTFTRTTLGEE